MPITIVVLPEHVARHWRERLLYNQTAKRLKAALIDREHTVVATSRIAAVAGRA